MNESDNSLALQLIQAQERLDAEAWIEVMSAHPVIADDGSTTVIGSPA